LGSPPDQIENTKKQTREKRERSEEGKRTPHSETGGKTIFFFDKRGVTFEALFSKGLKKKRKTARKTSEGGERRPKN